MIKEENIVNVKKDGKNNKDIILKCALDLFYKKGYEAVGVQEIVDVAGITKPTLYYYFKSKYGLLEQLLEGGCRQLCNDILAAVEQRSDLAGVLQRFAKVYLDFGLSNIKLLNLILAFQYSPKESEPHKAVAPYVINLFKAVTNIFEDSKNQLGNMHGRQEQFAIGFLGILNHYLLVYTEKDIEERDCISEHEVFMIVHQFMHGIYS